MKYKITAKYNNKIVSHVYKKKSDIEKIKRQIRKQNSLIKKNKLLSKIKLITDVKVKKIKRR